MTQAEVNEIVLASARRLHARGMLWFTTTMLLDEINAHLEDGAPAASAVSRATFYLRQDRHIHRLLPGNFHYSSEQNRYRLAGFKPQSSLEA